MSPEATAACQSRGGGDPGGVGAGGRGGAGFFAVQAPPIHSQCDAVGAAAQSACDLKHALQGGFGHAHGGVSGGAGPLQIVQLEHPVHEPHIAHEQSEPLTLPGWQSQNGGSRVAQDGGSSVAKAGRANMTTASARCAALPNGKSIMRRRTAADGTRIEADQHGKEVPLALELSPSSCPSPGWNCFLLCGLCV
jgi:hypothetical protein